MKSSAGICRRIREQLLLGTTVEEAAVADHLETCIGCRKFAGAVKTLTAVGHAMRRTKLSQNTVRETRFAAAAILSARSVSCPPTWSILWPRVAFLGALSLVTLALGLWFPLWLKPHKTKTQSAVSSALAAELVSLETATERVLSETARDRIRSLEVIFRQRAGDDLGKRVSSLSRRIREFAYALEEELSVASQAPVQM
ncbi:MAG: hypothetical protein ACUVWX_01730 [Kiritimatiellia bacterium]